METLKKVGAFLGMFFLVSLFIFVPVYLGMKAEKTFQAECVQVGGYISIDREDGDLECYVGSNEIAEFGENSPLEPKP